MYLTHIELHHFRGAKKLNIDLDQKLNVFYGINGAGKTTVLDATAQMLSWIVTRLKNTRGSGRPIKNIDIQNGASVASTKILGRYDERPFSIHLEKSRPGHQSKRETKTEISLHEIIPLIHESLINTDFPTIPLFAYYPVNRVVLNIPLRIRTRHDFGILDAHEGALTSGANFRTFFEWFREREDMENENFKSTFNKRTEITQALVRNEYQDTQLQASRTAIHQFMPNFSDLIIKRSPLRMEIKKGAQTLQVDQLSDGEKCLMALVGDIARRLAIANPNSNKPLEGMGIVVIDEIDLHLHPIWQHSVIPQLTATFPNCQFMVSTHSPHILAHVRPENLFALDMRAGELIMEKPRESYGKNVEQILNNNMNLPNTRPDMVAKDLDEIYSFIDANKLDKAKKKIELLRTTIGCDIELFRASALIKRKELVGK